MTIVLVPKILQKSRKSCKNKTDKNRQKMLELPLEKIINEAITGDTKTITDDKPDITDKPELESKESAA